MKLLVALVVQYSVCVVGGQPAPSTCDTVACLDGFKCDTSANGLPECVSTDPVAPYVPPSWFRAVKRSFDGIAPLKRCNGMKDQQPTSGTRCPRLPRTCLFNTQLCGSGVPSPMTECFCDGADGDRTWICEAVPCLTATLGGVCPEPDGFGTCVEQCSVEVGIDCPEGQLCCSNGCGHVCTDPVEPAEQAVDGVCPEPVGFGICVEECSAEAAGNDCPDGQLCCSNGCGHVCLDAVAP